jgi:hypothetical protein
MQSPEEFLLGKLRELKMEIQIAKPDDRSAVDRRYAIVLTELEKIEAYMHYYIVTADLKHRISFDE